jgi:alcohol dehydrogenase
MMQPEKRMPLTLQQVPKPVCGAGAVNSAAEHLRALGVARPFVVAARSGQAHAGRFHPNAHVDTIISCELTVTDFERLQRDARAFAPDAIVGIGGGSVLDVAKLVAVLTDNAQSLREVWGIGNLAARKLPLICILTNSGTGSEVSPHSILLDKQTPANKAVISPHLVPEAALVDPALTLTAPPHVTATTGLDALTHCIEAFANDFAHPLVDTWALDGIRHLAAHLGVAVRDPGDLNARTHFSLSRLYGGLCLGPVNTAAVHALSYPLGSRHHIAQAWPTPSCCLMCSALTCPPPRNVTQPLRLPLGPTSAAPPWPRRAPASSIFGGSSRRRAWRCGSPLSAFRNRSSPRWLSMASPSHASCATIPAP